MNNRFLIIVLVLIFGCPKIENGWLTRDEAGLQLARLMANLVEEGSFVDSLAETNDSSQSWRYYICLPVDLQIEDLQPGKPWNYPGNLQCESLSPGRAFTFRSNRTSAESRNEDYYHTKVMAVTGPRTAFDRTVRFKDVNKNVILAVEVKDSNLHWMAPGDLTVDGRANTLGRVGGHYSGGFFVAFADGQVWFLKNNTPHSLLKQFLTVDIRSDREVDLRPVLIKRYVTDKTPQPAPFRRYP